MKEQFEYLIDEYGVDLAVNSEYATRNNLHSLAYVAGRIDNSYIIPCDIWCAVNPYSRTEPYSWYMVSDRMDEDSTVRVNRKRELVMVSEKEAGNAMIGIAYLTGREATIVRENLRKMDTDEDYDDEFWERALYGGGSAAQVLAGSAAQASPDFSGKPRFQRDRMIELKKILTERGE